MKFLFIKKKYEWNVFFMKNSNRKLSNIPTEMNERTDQKFIGCNKNHFQFFILHLFFFIFSNVAKKNVIIICMCNKNPKDDEIPETKQNKKNALKLPYEKMKIHNENAIKILIKISK